MPALNGIYADPAASLGSVLGGAGGAAAGASSGILGQLLSFLEPLDYARQAAWNVPDKLSQGDWLGALPGLGGLAVGAAAAPFVGIPGAIGAGALAALLGQGAGKLSGSSSFQARSPHEVFSQMTGADPEGWGSMLGGMALGALTDPLTYAGMPFGSQLGGAAGRRAGSALEEAAWARGPGYAATTAPIDAMTQYVGANALHTGEDLGRLSALRQAPQLSQILSEIPPGSTPLGMGAEGFAWKTPQGDVVRIAGGPGAIDVPRTVIEGQGLVRIPPPGGRAAMPPYPTPVAPEVLQPAREVFHGDYAVQRNPFVSEMYPNSPSPAQTRAFDEAITQMQERLGERGLDFRDAHEGNVGQLASGNWVVSDPGAVVDFAAAPGRAARQPGALTSWLLDALNSNQAVRNEIQNRLLAPQGVSLPGADALLRGAVPPPALPQGLFPQSIPYTAPMGRPAKPY